MRALKVMIEEDSMKEEHLNRYRIPISSCDDVREQECYNHGRNNYSLYNNK